MLKLYCCFFIASLFLVLSYHTQQNKYEWIAEKSGFNDKEIILNVKLSECTPIANCKLLQCTNGTHHRCRRCNYDRGHFEKAFRLLPDGGNPDRVCQSMYSRTYFAIETAEPINGKVLILGLGQTLPLPSAVGFALIDADVLLTSPVSTKIIFT